MPTSLTSFRGQLRESLLAFLWRQWSALGVSGHARTDDPRIIDPEALLLFSTAVARHDARLFDEILDWLQLNADALNLQRLARLQKDHGIGEESILAAMATQLTQGKGHQKWRVIAARAPRPAATGPVRLLFPHLPNPRRGDEDWLAWGWRCPPVELRGFSQPPLPDQPGTFLFKLRALFGLQARAEVIAWLLAHESGHPAEIARDTGYFRGSIQSVLNELASSGHIHARRTGREKHFAIEPEQWRFLLTWTPAGSFPPWIVWASRFATLRRVLDLVEQPRVLEMSPDALAIELRRAIDSDRLAHGSGANFLPPLSTGTDTEYLDHTLRALNGLLA